MQKNATALIMIILGLIVLVFPILGLIPLSLISGFIVLILGIGLLIGGIMDMGDNVALGVVEIILGIIALVLGIGFIVNPGLFSWLAGFIIWIVGLFLVIAGIIAVLWKAGGNRWNGIITVVIGIIYLIVGSLIANPIMLGALVGIWLLVTGVLMLFMKE